MWGNFSLKVSFMSFLRSEGLTYSMTVVWKEKPEVASTRPHFQHWARRLDPHTPVLDSNRLTMRLCRGLLSPMSPKGWVRWSDKHKPKPKKTLLDSLTLFFITINAHTLLAVFGHQMCIHPWKQSLTNSSLIAVIAHYWVFWFGAWWPIDWWGWGFASMRLLLNLVLEHQ